MMMVVSWFDRRVAKKYPFHASAAAAVALRHVPPTANVQLLHFLYVSLVFDIERLTLRRVCGAFDPHYDPAQRCVDPGGIDRGFDVD